MIERLLETAEPAAERRASTSIGNVWSKIVWVT